MNALPILGGLWMAMLATSGASTLHAQSEPPGHEPSGVHQETAVSRWGTQAELGPLWTRLAIVEGTTLQRGQSVHAEVELCNREASPMRGEISILSTAAWQVRPGRVFPFDLARENTCFRQAFEVSLLDDASPGPYDLVLRVEARGNEIGTLRTRFMRPMEWLVIGPFAAVPSTELLPPEQGIHLEGSQAGLEGPVSWQHVQPWAYDVTGNLELDLVLGSSPMRRCACAFTIIDLADAETLHWKAPGAQRVLLDGRALEPGRPVGVTPGRHTLLVRICGTDADWKLGLTLLRNDGTWPRNLENNIDRFLPGFGETWGKEDSSPTLRHVVLQVRPGRARDVAVLGTFNAWVPWPLTRDADGSWKRELFLPPGRHAYKLRVDGVLTPDATSQRREPDGFGGTNSLLIVR